VVRPAASRFPTVVLPAEDGRRRRPPAGPALMLVAAIGGLRWGELVGLRRKRIDLERGTVTVAEQLVPSFAHAEAWG
jgi:integrase